MQETDQDLVTLSGISACAVEAIVAYTSGKSLCIKPENLITEMEENKVVVYVL